VLVETALYCSDAPLKILRIRGKVVALYLGVFVDQKVKSAHLKAAR
jgi:hypothetical protein